MEPTAIELELSNEQIEGLCDLVNNEIVRNDVNPPQMVPAIRFHRRVVPPLSNNNSERKSLPVTKFEREIMNGIDTNRVILISGGTGCGKTTQVPQFILENCTRTQKSCKIVCTQPRRLATVAIAKRVARERNERLPATVGYQVRADCKMTPSSSLVFMTR